jgi:sarcosine oxidase, subunit gamma
MVEAYMQQSALAHLGLNARPGPEQPTGVILAEMPMTGQIGLRLDATDQKILQAAEKAIGFALPVTPNTATTKGKKAALWLGPDEWLLTTTAEQAGKLAGALTKALQGHHAAIFDVSDSRITISLSGENARDVLKKGCGLDLHPKSFTTGQCAQSTLALAHVLIHQVSETKKTKAATYQLFIHRSFAEYTWAWLEDAAGEYGVKVSAG